MSDALTLQGFSRGQDHHGVEPDFKIWINVLKFDNVIGPYDKDRGDGELIMSFAGGSFQFVVIIRGFVDNLEGNPKRSSGGHCFV